MSRGRHRKPTRTGRNLAVVASTGAFALPAVAFAAPAASADPLDEIARCESGNNPNASNGTHFGLFQFSRSTWASVGGSGDPRNASVAEQRARAETLLAQRGTQPWAASQSCWAGKTGGAVTHRATAQPTRRPAAPKAAPKAKAGTAPRSGLVNGVGGLGVRAADGTGRYVCDTAHLYFDACDDDTLGQVEQYPLYDGLTAPARIVTAAPAATQLGARIADDARRYLGAPYTWAGTSRNGFDCSGLVYRVLQDQGIAAPRTAAGQSQWVRRISAADARPGDLVFYYSPVSHVGIVTGNGMMVDSSMPGTRVTERAIYPGIVAWYGRIPG